MEHYEIEDSFKRQTTPIVELDFFVQRTHRRGGSDGSFWGIAINLVLKNVSMISARFPYLIVKFPGDPWKISSRFPMRYDRENREFLAGVDEVIHPEMSTAMVALEREISGELKNGAIRFRSNRLPQLSIPVAFGCYNARQMKANLIVNSEDILKAFPEADIF